MLDTTRVQKSLEAAKHTHQLLMAACGAIAFFVLLACIVLFLSIR